MKGKDKNLHGLIPSVTAQDYNKPIIIYVIIKGFILGKTAGAGFMLMNKNSGNQPATEFL